MATCDRCGAFVSGVTRVFGTNHGNVYGCLDCTTMTGLVDGEAARVDS